MIDLFFCAMQNLISAVPPDPYGRRFAAYFKRITNTDKVHMILQHAQEENAPEVVNEQGKRIKLLPKKQMHGGAPGMARTASVVQAEGSAAHAGGSPEGKGKGKVEEIHVAESDSESEAEAEAGGAASGSERKSKPADGKEERRKRRRKKEQDGGEEREKRHRRKKSEAAENGGAKEGHRSKRRKKKVSADAAKE